MNFLSGLFLKGLRSIIFAETLHALILPIWNLLLCATTSCGAKDVPLSVLETPTVPKDTHSIFSIRP